MSWRNTYWLLLLYGVPTFADSCSKLSALTLPNTTITLAQRVEPGALAIAAAPRLKAPGVAFCRLAATLKPSPDSDIKIELWLPEAGWNGKYLAVGNGGWSGSINYTGLGDGLRRGYATSSTDTGHEGGSASFALGHPEKLIDYAYRSEHEMAVTSKTLITSYYTKAARLAYWNGCSAGGKQGLKEAQRYPNDFDGIVAGAPAANWIGRATQSIWAAQAVHNDEASYIPPAKYPMIHKAVLAACDALDGVADGVLENPRRCAFDPAVLACTGDDASACLTAAQVAAARKLYSSSINPRTGKALYTGLERGSELGWATWAGPRPLGIGLDYFRYVVFEKPDWDFRTLNFDADIARAEELDANRINALDPDLKPFFSHGGRLIQYHGWNDPQISPGNSVAYYDSVAAKLGPGIGTNYRLFMVPGMGHCGGGEGTSSFDMLAALEAWVEKSTAPASIPASRLREGKVDRTRPLCAYPLVAVYQGSGDVNETASFACGAGR